MSEHKLLNVRKKLYFLDSNIWNMLLRYRLMIISPIELCSKIKNKKLLVPGFLFHHIQHKIYLFVRRSDRHGSYPPIFHISWEIAFFSLSPMRFRQIHNRTTQKVVLLFSDAYHMVLSCCITIFILVSCLLNILKFKEFSGVLCALNDKDSTMIWMKRWKLNVLQENVWREIFCIFFVSGVFWWSLCVVFAYIIWILCTEMEEYEYWYYVKLLYSVLCVPNTLQHKLLSLKMSFSHFFDRYCHV